MKNINLLPKKEKKSDARIILLNFFIVIFVFILLISILAVLMVRDIGNELAQRLTKYEDVNMELNEYVTKLESYKDFEELVEEKENNISFINIENIKWSSIIYDVSSSKPEGIYITNFTGSTSNLYQYINKLILGEEIEDEDKSAFIIQGYARDQFEVSKYVLALENIPNISEVWINTINVSDVPGTEQNAYFYRIETFWDIEKYDDLKPESSNKEEVPFEDEGIQQIEIEQ